MLVFCLFVFCLFIFSFCFVSFLFVFALFYVFTDFEKYNKHLISARREARKHHLIYSIFFATLAKKIIERYIDYNDNGGVDDDDNDNNDD